MIRKTFTLLVLASAFLSITSVATADGISDKWKGTVQTDDGPLELIFEFKVTGDKLTGRVDSSIGGGDLMKGEVDGKAFSFEVLYNDTILIHMCKLEADDTILVVVDGLPEILSYKLHRMKEEEVATEA